MALCHIDLHTIAQLCSAGVSMLHLLSDLVILLMKMYLCSADLYSWLSAPPASFNPYADSCLIAQC